MSGEVIFVFALVAAAVAVFVLDRLPIGLVAMMVMTALLLSGVLSVREGLSGFSSRATVTIAAMFMLSEGVRRTGALDRLGSLIARIGDGKPDRTLLTMMLAVGSVSAFVNNTAAIAIFIPVVVSVAASMDVSPSRLLMPISFASMFGGACTLIGTSTNILVSEIAAERGLAPLGIFELAPVGLVFAAIGLGYLFTAGRRLVPARRSPGAMSGYDLKRYITDARVSEDSVLVGRPLREDDRLASGGAEVLNVFRDGRELPGRIDAIEPRPGDVLRIHGDVEAMGRTLERSGLRPAASAGHDKSVEEPGERILIEALVPPESSLVHTRIRDASLGERFGAVPVAILQRGKVEHDAIADIRLEAGDVLLLAVEQEHLDGLHRDSPLVMANRVPRESFRRGRMPLAVAVIAGVVAATALDLAPVVVNALAGVVVMILGGCLRLDEAMQAVHGEVILLLAGMIPLGVALEKTGAAAMIAEALIGLLDDRGPQVLLSGLLLFTILLTSILNNQASAVLLAPMVIELARSLEADPRPFLIAVTYGASLSFITPVGYQTNTMVYGPGQYRFTDFFRVGIGLNLLLWIAGSLLIPLRWPLGG